MTRLAWLGFAQDSSTRERRDLFSIFAMILAQTLLCVKLFAHFIMVAKIVPGLTVRTPKV